ncbi:MAG: stearoyl-CoA desaturase (delta-9 desaturase) [Halieaceae bacterium]|jgi:stearoyl-CoA desaturase (delta-9 desaturase)
MDTADNKPPLLLVQAIMLWGTALAAVILVPWYGLVHGYDMSIWVLALVVLYLNGISITGGYHRLWAHKTYDAHPLLRLGYALFGAGALQNSILIWAADHRRHHRHVDNNELDPYSAGRGLWYSHIGWMLREYSTQGQQLDNVQDLQRDAIVDWQHRHYLAIALAMNIGLPLVIGFIHGDIIGCLLLIGLLRLVVNHHVTFCINSLAHYWGSQPYTDTNSARDNHFIAFLTYGEGYHNYHHQFQTDYRNGVRWFHWDPTKWVISLFSFLGLASNLKRIPRFKIQRALLAMQFEQARARLSQAGDSDYWGKRLEVEYQEFLLSLNQWKQLQQTRLEDQRNAMGELLQDKWDRAALRTRFKELEYALKMQRKRLQYLILQFQPS